jgi:uncharacterized protein (TIGR02391 family)
MPVAPTAFPSLEECRELPLDRLALRLLAVIADDERTQNLTQIQIQRVISRDRWLTQVGGDHRRLAEFLRLLQEAWDWLVSHGLIASSEPSQHPNAGWTFVTRAGRRALEDGGTSLAAEARLDVALHPRLRDRVRSPFLMGKYEIAAFAALREVEIRVRELSGASQSLLGTKLMTEAFRPSGPLFDPELDRGESTAMMNLFQGAIGLFKNPSSHRAVEYADPTEASEVILTADLLLRLLDRIEQRPARP